MSRVGRRLSALGGDCLASPAGTYAGADLTGGSSGGEPVAGPEVTSTNGLVRGVSQPTMTVYLPTGMNTGAAAVVFPGEDYTVLAIGLKGTEVCDWLTSQGITTVLLKYRVQGPGFYRRPAPFPKSGPYPKSPMALEDAQRAVGPVRFHAAEWHIDPHKIGVLGFSAGGHLLAAMRTHFDKRLYPPVYAADKVSCRPDFCGCSLSGALMELDLLEQSQDGIDSGYCDPYLPRDAAYIPVAGGE